jgi:hypothetical protein
VTAALNSITYFCGGILEIEIDGKVLSLSSSDKLMC